MHPTRERECDELLEHPGLRSPPKPPPKQRRGPRLYRQREFKIAASTVTSKVRSHGSSKKKKPPPRFPLITPAFYASWCNHLKELQMARHVVDDHPPPLFPELYLKPRRLDYYAMQVEETMNVNKDLLKRINVIQRTGGYVDCWLKQKPSKTGELLCKQRQRALNMIQKKNKYFYKRLLVARSEQSTTKELDEQWKDTKHKLILGAAQPFILFKTGRIDRDMVDPEFEKPPNVTRNRVSLDIWVEGGSKIGKVTVELFNEIAPLTCKLFMNLVKGESTGHAYAGTRFFRIVPNLYCCGGDVCKDNGFGCYLPEGQELPMPPENFVLKHSVPGVLSMAVNKDNEVCGFFNIIFKPLPQFDGKHVVFGRIVAGPALTLERISAIGLPLGTTTSDCVMRHVGYYTRGGRYREGNLNAIRFPPKRKH